MQTTFEHCHIHIGSKRQKISSHPARKICPASNMHVQQNIQQPVLTLRCFIMYRKPRYVRSPLNMYLRETCNPSQYTVHHGYWATNGEIDKTLLLITVCVLTKTNKDFNSQKTN